MTFWEGQAISRSLTQHSHPDGSLQIANFGQNGVRVRNLTGHVHNDISDFAVRLEMLCHDVHVVAREDVVEPFQFARDVALDLINLVAEGLIGNWICGKLTAPVVEPIPI